MKLPFLTNIFRNKNDISEDKEVIPSYTLREMLTDLIDFRENQPESGSPDMIEQLSELFFKLDNLEPIKLPSALVDRNRTISNLAELLKVQDDFRNSNWRWLGQAFILYPPKNRSYKMIPQVTSDTEEVIRHTIEKRLASIYEKTPNKKISENEDIHEN